MNGLKNLMEDTVEQTLNRLLPTMPNICACDDCKLDMATYALNRLPPKYARSSRGAILHRFDTLSTQVEAEILTVCVSAINIIGSHPHHAENKPAQNNVQPQAAAQTSAPQQPTTGNQ